MRVELLIITMQLKLFFKIHTQRLFCNRNYNCKRIDYQNSFISVDFGSFIKKRTNRILYTNVGMINNFYFFLIRVKPSRKGRITFSTRLSFLISSLNSTIPRVYSSSGVFMLTTFPLQSTLSARIKPPFFT